MIMIKYFQLIDSYFHFAVLDPLDLQLKEKERSGRNTIMGKSML